VSVAAEGVAGLLQLKLQQAATGIASGFAAAKVVEWNFCNTEFTTICWYGEPQSITPGEIVNVTVAVPDGPWELVRRHRRAPALRRLSCVCARRTVGSDRLPEQEFGKRSGARRPLARRAVEHRARRAAPVLPC